MSHSLYGKDGVFMIEKRIRGFYNSVQITGDLSEECAKKIGRIRLVVRIGLGFAAAVAAARAVMYLADAVGEKAAKEIAD